MKKISQYEIYLQAKKDEEMSKRLLKRRTAVINVIAGEFQTIADERNQLNELLQSRLRQSTTIYGEF